MCVCVFVSVFVHLFLCVCFMLFVEGCPLVTKHSNSYAICLDLPLDVLIII